jgi:hypothetical protein
VPAVPGGGGGGGGGASSGGFLSVLSEPLFFGIPTYVFVGVLAAAGIYFFMQGSDSGEQYADPYAF